MTVLEPDDERPIDDEVDEALPDQLHPSASTDASDADVLEQVLEVDLDDEPA